MYYCKDFFPLGVLSLYEGELIGQVDKLFFDKKLKKLMEIEMVGSDGAKFGLLTKNIYKVGKNAITVRNNQSVTLKQTENEFIPCPIGAKAYSITGEFLGVVQEICLNDKFVVEKVCLDNDNLLEISQLASCGKNTMIFYVDKKINLQAFEPKAPKLFKKKTVQIAKTLPVEEKLETETENNNKEILQEEVKVPTQNANFLLGRVCTKDIFNFNNELLIKAHSLVNKKNLKEINKYGKLKELMLFIK